MYRAVQNLINDGHLPVVEQFKLPAREASYASIPRFLFDSRMGMFLHKQFKEGDTGSARLWSHQARALDMLGNGENVVVSTGTASGKSLIFRSLAFHKTLLDPNARTLVFYPLKALAADQILGWKQMASELGLRDEYVGRVDGTVPVRDREEILNNARIVAMTPDVCHAWLMSRLSLSPIRDFVSSLSTLIMDEAHVLEGIFGSNFSFFFRRLVSARNHLLGKSQARPVQIVAATATIEEPCEHLKLLTGVNFSAVGHDQDGSPQYERLVAHVECPEGGETAVAKELHELMLANGTEGGFITFLDSRKGVEGLAISSRSGAGDRIEDLIDNADVLPYRAGYDGSDRARIEQCLKKGCLRGIVSTSALELGIDIPHLRVGFNIRVPSTRKAYRQRLGRVGRMAPGAFVVIGPRDCFMRYGRSFHEYHEMSVEPSYLYLDNRFMQFAHGRCLVEELESINAPPKTPTRVGWPTGFSDIHAAARPAGNRPPEFDAITALGGDSPQYGYPLRNVGETNFQIKAHANADSIGEVSQQQALRECYPGATYLHLTRAYEIMAWHTNSFESFIRVKATSPHRQTNPRITTWVNAGATAADIQANHFVRSEYGFLVECLMQVTERVEGYVDKKSGKVHTYRELQQKNPNLKPRMRNFRTTGVVLCLHDGVFKQSKIRRAFADRLCEVFVREYSIASRDVSATASNICVRLAEGGGVRSDSIAIYDETYGSLRLTERLFLYFSEIVEQLAKAIQNSDSKDEELDMSTVQAISKAVSAFSAPSSIPVAPVESHDGVMQVFTRRSRVCYHQAGQMAMEVQVLQPTIMEGNLMYQIETPPKPGQRPAKRWVAAKSIEPSAAEAGEWSYALWDPSTEEYVEENSGE